MPPASARRLFDPFFDLVDATPAMRELVLGELSSSHRHWHGLLHHGLMLRSVQAARHAPADLRLVVLAALFHDIVYNATRADNEERSADTARRWVAPADADAVAAMILATKRHDLNTDPVTRALLLADLAVLWTPSARLYDFYARGIRAEYGHVPDQAYRTGREVVLRTLEQQLRPYLPDAEAGRLRGNLAREIGGLKDGRFDLG